MVASLLAVAALPGSAGAAQVQQDYPGKPIRMIVGFPGDGNAVDASARVTAQRMGEALGTEMVIENHPGDGGSLAAGIASRATPDGHTLWWANAGAHIIKRITEPNFPYNADTAFAPVGRAFSLGNALIVHKTSSITTLAQLLLVAKETPGQLKYGTLGVGSAGHLSGQMLQQLSGVSLNHVPYKGLAELVTAVFNGTTPIGVVSISAAAVTRTRMRVLAVTTPQRDTGLPDVPSMQEAGVKNYDASFWFGIMVPAGTPAVIIERLGKGMRSALADPEVVRLGRSLGLSAAPTSAADFAELIKADYEKWKKVIGRS